MKLRERCPHAQTGFVVDLIDRRAADIIKTHKKKLIRLVKSEDHTFGDVAKKLLPDDCLKSVKIASDIVATAAKALLDPQVYIAIAKRNIAIGSRRADHRNTESLIAQGKVLWSPEERSRLEQMSNDEQYHYPPSHRHAGEHDVEKIRRDLNRDFKGKRKKRSVSAVANELRRIRERNEAKGGRG